jgi:glutamine amidotransferase
MSVAIVDYGSGNLHSAHKALERAARESGSGADIRLTSNPYDVRKAERIVLPGVGAFADCRRGLDAVDGMVEALNEAVIEEGKPFLGICVGMQLMATRGLEHQVTEGLGWIPGDVVAIEPADPILKIPHMGWNTLDVQRQHKLIDGIATGENGLHAYFVHSFHLKPASPDLMIAETDHGGALTAIVGRDNLVGTQFHPEKSQTLGLALLRNFLRWRP